MKDYRIVNLELNHPSVRDMPARIEKELRQARGHQIRVLKFIHGYGSTGRGGKLRPAVRQVLDRVCAAGQIVCYVPGERFSIFDTDTQRALQTCAELRRDPDLERHNNGVTFVLLSVH
nr:Smr/MutS family protein [uncultured Butyricicoccus sp.]